MMTKIKISQEWTPKERLLIIQAMTDSIRDDIAAGCYSVRGRCNVQSVHEFIHATPEELNAQYRDVFEKIANDYWNNTHGRPVWEAFVNGVVN